MDVAVARERARAGWTKAIDDAYYGSVDECFAAVDRGEACWLSTGKSDVFARMEGEALSIGPACGDLEDLPQIMSAMERYARHCGASQIYLTGRPGWVRALKPYGYEFSAAIVRKKL